MHSWLDNTELDRILLFRLLLKMSFPQPYDGVLGNTKTEAQKALEASISNAWHSQDTAYSESWKAIGELDFNHSNKLSAKFNQAVAYSKGLMDSYKIIYGENALAQLMQQHQRLWKWNYTVAAKK